MEVQLAVPPKKEKKLKGLLQHFDVVRLHKKKGPHGKHEVWGRVPRGAVSLALLPFLLASSSALYATTALDNLIQGAQTPTGISIILAGLVIVAHVVQGFTPPYTIAHKIADKVLAVGPNVFDLFGIGPDAPGRKIVAAIPPPTQPGIYGGK